MAKKLFGSIYHAKEHKGGAEMSGKSLHQPLSNASQQALLALLGYGDKDWTKINELLLGDQKKNRMEIQSTAMAIYILKRKPPSRKKKWSYFAF